MASEMHKIRDKAYLNSNYENITKLFYIIEDINFGICLNQCWVKLTNDDKLVDKLDNILEMDQPDNTLLCLLEINLIDFKKILCEALMDNNLSSVISETFPYELIILNGLYTKSDWWVNLALDWFIELPLNDMYNYEPIIACLEQIKVCKSYPQNIRHKANRAIVKYKNFNNPS